MSGAAILNAREIHGPLRLTGNVTVAHDLRVQGPLKVTGVLGSPVSRVDDIR